MKILCISFGKPLGLIMKGTPTPTPIRKYSEQTMKGFSSLEDIVLKFFVLLTYGAQDSVTPSLSRPLCDLHSPFHVYYFYSTMKLVRATYNPRQNGWHDPRYWRQMNISLASPSPPPIQCWVLFLQRCDNTPTLFWGRGGPRNIEHYIPKWKILATRRFFVKRAKDICRGL